MGRGRERAHDSGSSVTAHRANSYVAIGDSFTEGLNDPAADNASYRGWADRLAEILAANDPELHYANLAVRGKLLDQVIGDQLPAALALRPSLVSLVAGGNDILRPGNDPDLLAERFDAAVAELRAHGAQVLIGTGFDTRQVPVMRHVRGRVGTYNSHLWAIAERHECRVIDLWSMRVLQDPRAWSTDRLHLSPEGHRRVALRAAETLGLEVDEDWRRSWPPQPERPWHVQLTEDLRWVREHLAPWIGRRLRGRSSGDGRSPKRPELQRL
ncbi:lysophospholipase L1-like esterase [Halopolyspora algeriensis]|uniref:Lysophospholipase L1-like esterase n=1 Tax=Halopolyspora algeriensis TaxID=1500506 RepID=A0A368VVU1_9ACTN|nr:SGNH/GDSL hydrolase family protein [Halopolyspora algeriensis]RCW43543.1 lysophospholipase L1-like esterase [Halopolyspora algeriensis]TQM46412.1 lysophospholipase L1-like esterase [Halopolyspora algeriensis]